MVMGMEMGVEMGMEMGSQDGGHFSFSPQLIAQPKWLAFALLARLHSLCNSWSEF